MTTQSKTKRKEKLPKQYTKTLLAAITDLSEKGLNKSSISRRLGFTVNAFRYYAEVDLAYQTGKDLLAEKVCEAIISSDDYRDRNILAGRLALFQREINIPKIIDITSLIKAQGAMLNAFCESKITSEQLSAFTKSSVSMQQSYFDEKIQDELDKLKQELSDMKGK